MRNLQNILIEHNIYGSSNSDDYLIMVKIDRPITSNLEEIMQKYDFILPYQDKRKDINLCTIKDGVMNWCLNGLADELNNMVLYTYTLHKQIYACIVKNKVNRKKNEKISSLTKTISSILGTEFSNEKNLDSDWITKAQRRKIAFQLAQAFALLSNIELYTVHDCIDYIGLPQLFLFGSRDVSLNTLKHLYLEHLGSVNMHHYMPHI